MTKILITRPLKSSLQTAKILDKKNISYSIFPLFSIKKSQDLKPIKGKAQAVLITSNEAIFALLKLGIKKDVLILTVGEETLKKVQKLGYKNAIAAANSATSLLQLAQKQLNKKEQIFYLSGQNITLDLAKELESKGFAAKRIIVYKTIEIQNFSTRIINEIKEGEISEVLIYSQNSLKIFHKLIQKHDLSKFSNRLKISCLSSKIAASAKKLKFLKIEIKKI